MSLDAITAHAVQSALRAIRYGNALADSPLLTIDLVTSRLRADGLADTQPSRAWALAHCLEGTVVEQLARQRGTTPAIERAERSADAVIDQLRADQRSRNVDRLNWGLLHTRYLLPQHLLVQEVATGLGLTDRALRNRLARGCEALAAALRQQEVAAGSKLATDLADSPYDRLVFSAEAPERASLVVMGELLGAVRGNGAAAHLTPAQANGVAHYPASELAAFRVGRIAEWGQPRYRLDERFVALSLLVDLGEESESGRWKVQERRFSDLGAALAEVSEPAVVLLGPPGSGKSTLLRRLELDLAVEALRREGRDEAGAVTFLVSLNQYRPPAPGEPLPAPKTWLAERWSARFPKMPPLPELLAEGGVVLLLDGLNEMPGAGPEGYRERVGLWKQFLHETLVPETGNRAVIGCRSLDYSAPLSTPARRVPQVRLEPLTDEQVQDFLARHSPANAAALWEQLAGTRLLDALRWPYFLRLLVEDAADTGAVPTSLAELFTGFVRRALVREVERDNPHFAPGELLSARDYERLVSGRGWRTATELPVGGPLIPALSDLAYGIQDVAVSGESSQARLRYEAALRLLPAAQAEDVVRAGVDLGVMEVDQAADELQFSHQLVQEYFAGRRLAAAPEPARVAALWRVADIRPGLREILDTLPRAETLPELPQTGWEETTLLAASMIEQPEPFLRGLMSHNLVVAGRAARLPAVQSKLEAAFLDELRWALVARSRDLEADLRARIDAGLTLGWLGDPRFERRMGPHGEYLVPPLAAIPGGEYPIGDDAPILDFDITLTSHCPRHTVEISPFSLGRFPVTNGEWACFMAAGGYEEERWWDTPDALAWQQGAGTAAGYRAIVRFQTTYLKAHPEMLERRCASGDWPVELCDLYRRRFLMTEPEFEAHVQSAYPGGKLREPASWRDERLNNPSQPVSGVSWYEARAYCAWLSSQTGQHFCLPSEVETEAAQRGRSGRRWAYGETFDPLRANVYQTRLKCTSPVGVFAEGDTPEGASDLCGNAPEWTLSLWGTDNQTPDFRYPYRADDGRQRESAGPDVLRVFRAGHGNGMGGSRAAARFAAFPDFRLSFRLCAPFAAAGIGVDA